VSRAVLHGTGSHNADGSCCPPRRVRETRTAGRELARPASARACGWPGAIHRARASRSRQRQHGPTARLARAELEARPVSGGDREQGPFQHAHLEPQVQAAGRDDPGPVGRASPRPQGTTPARDHRPLDRPARRRSRLQLCLAAARTFQQHLGDEPPGLPPRLSRATRFAMTRSSRCAVLHRRWHAPESSVIVDARA